MSEAVIAYGATVERSLDGITYTRVPEATGVAVPSTVREYVEVTNLDSPDGYREYIKGLRDAGEISLPANYTSASYARQLTDSDAADAIHYRVTMPLQPSQATQDIITFRGFPVPSLEGGDVGGKVEMTINIRTTGSVSFAEGTGLAAVLSSPTGTQTSATTADLSVTTTIGAGTLYAGVFPTADTPTSSAIIAGTGATWSGSVDAPGVGAEAFSATGLTAATAYKAHFVQVNGGTESNVAVSAEFTTAA